MKTTLLFFSLILFFGISNPLHAQNVKLNLYSGYTFDDEIEAITNNNNYFKGTIKGGYQWGIGIEYAVQPTYGIELAYFRQDTDFPVQYTTGQIIDTNKTFGLGTNFIMLGGNKYVIIPRSIVMPYGGLMVGMAILNNKDPLPGGETSATKFSWGARAGLYLKFSTNVGLRIQGQMLSAVQSVDGGFYLGTGGTGAGLSTESSMYQFGVGGALVIEFGKTKIKKRK